MGVDGLVPVAHVGLDVHGAGGGLVVRLLVDGLVLVEPGGSALLDGLVDGLVPVEHGGPVLFSSVPVLVHVAPRSEEHKPEL